MKIYATLGFIPPWLFITYNLMYVPEISRIGLKFQPRRKNINLDNKTRFSYPEGYCLC